LEDPEIFIKDPVLGNYFEKAVSESYCWAQDNGCDKDKKEIVKICANYLTTDLQYLLKMKGRQQLKKNNSRKLWRVCLFIAQEKSPAKSLNYSRGNV